MKAYEMRKLQLALLVMSGHLTHETITLGDRVDLFHPKPMEDGEEALKYQASWIVLDHLIRTDHLLDVLFSDRE